MGRELHVDVTLSCERLIGHLLLVVFLFFVRVNIVALLFRAACAFSSEGNVGGSKLGWFPLLVRGKWTSVRFAWRQGSGWLLQSALPTQPSLVGAGYSPDNTVLPSSRQGYYWSAYSIYIVLDCVHVYRWNNVFFWNSSDLAGLHEIVMTLFAIFVKSFHQLRLGSPASMTARLIEYEF